MLPDALPTISYKQSLHVAFIRAIILGIQTTSSCLYIDLQTNQNQNNPESAMTSPLPLPLHFSFPPVYIPPPPKRAKTPSRTKMCHTVDEAFSTIWDCGLERHPRSRPISLPAVFVYVPFPTELFQRLVRGTQGLYPPLAPTLYIFSCSDQLAWPISSGVLFKKMHKRISTGFIILGFVLEDHRYWADLTWVFAITLLYVFCIFVKKSACRSFGVFEQINF